ncbi:MAG: 4-(cytidine 5'-diphospho)-2-C-methyl-D-erythritol kinase [Muribaculaceae bacterium]|nr:4-(cytidine 5'-diphospho)-2-C-methyl-D-erythritol kinase [Muribaculaceae bacterium]
MLVFPNAKINLGLDILSRRPDGYHDISTVMVPVPWRDVLEIVPARGEVSTLTVTGRRVDCPPEKNLVMRAYRLMEERFGLPPVDIYLRKVIPDGAGLGGGSADASFTLRVLDEHFALGLDDETLASMAAHLGADCPLFIFNRPMLATGTGTDLSPIDVDLSGMTIVIVKPPVSVPTAQAYSRVTPAVPPEPIPEILQSPVSEWQGRLKNDFETSVFPLHPMLPEIKDKLLDIGAVYASMSGSGSSLFGLFTSDILAERVADTFRGCQTFTANL